MTLPSIKQLRYLVALEKHRHFGRAARACYVSQPAFSVAIRELESLLNVRLVDRTRKYVTITSIGRDISAQAKLVLNDLEGLVDIARHQQQPLTGRLHLGVIPTIAPFLLPKLLPKLRKSWPELKLYPVEDQTERIYKQLMHGDLDVILIALPYDLKGTENMVLFRDHFFLACRKDTRLIDPEHCNVDQLPQESILLLEDGHCLRDHALTACRIRNRDKISHVAASSMLTLIHMVSADLGVTFIPEMAVGSPLLKNTRVAARPMKSSSYREIGLVWRKGTMRSQEFRMLGEFIRSNSQRKS
ncbi:MAG: hydrogen peroxide-inducible genes activator [Gammaproteobacteria bacterium]